MIVNHVLSCSATRQRERLLEFKASHIQHMHKALMH